MPYHPLQLAAHRLNLALVDAGLVLLTWGNASVLDRTADDSRGHRGVLAIKPSGVPYDKLTPDDLVLLSLTTGGPEGAYAPDGFNGDLQAILRPLHRGMLEFTGFEVLAPQIHYGPVRVEPAQREAWLQAWAERLRHIETETPIDVGRY